MTPDQLTELKGRYHSLYTDVHALIDEVEKLQAEKVALARQVFQAEARLIQITELITKQSDLVTDWIKRWELQQQLAVRWMMCATKPNP